MISPTGAADAGDVPEPTVVKTETGAPQPVNRRQNVAWQGSKGAPNTQTATTQTTGGGAVSVQVGGLKLSLKSDKDPALVENIAAYVDTKVGEVRSMAPSVALDKALMLASLTVAEELFDARERVRVLEAALRERVDNCLTALDELESNAR